MSYAQRAPNSSRKSLNDSSKDFGSYPRFAYARLRRLLGFSVLMLQPALEDLTGYRIQRCNLLEARMKTTTYNEHRSAPFLRVPHDRRRAVNTHHENSRQVYSVEGADDVI